MKLIRIGTKVVAIMDDGTTIVNNKVSEEVYHDILNHQDNELYVQRLLAPEHFKSLEQAEIKKTFLDGVQDSIVLEVRNRSVYIPSISELSLPEDLAVAIYQAEQEDNQDKVIAYMNFWTLVSLNPDSRARENLFWFLKRNGMTITSSGLFVAYKNVIPHPNSKQMGEDRKRNLYNFLEDCINDQSKNYGDFVGVTPQGEFICQEEIHFPNFTLGILKDLYDFYYIEILNKEDYEIYTDAYSKTFLIKLGVPQTQDRALCDPNQENTCSRGLHVGSIDWLNRGYFGRVPLQVLVNPADVVAVPPQDHYGKMRVCAYYPVKVLDYAEDGSIIDDVVTEVDEALFFDYFSCISYDGEVNNDDSSPYKVVVPEMVELDPIKIGANLETIRKEIYERIWE